VFFDPSNSAHLRDLVSYDTTAHRAIHWVPMLAVDRPHMASLAPSKPQVILM
jgi:hypothetical protein